MPISCCGFPPLQCLTSSVAGTLALHEVEPDQIESVSQSCHPRLVAVEGQLHPRGHRRECREGWLRAPTAHQDGVGIAGERGTQLLRVAATVPQVLEQVQIGSKDGALLHCWSTSPSSARRTGRATRRCTQLARDFVSQRPLCYVCASP